MKKHTRLLTLGLLAFVPALGSLPVSLSAQTDPVVEKIIELGTTDNQVMRWADYATNRFGGRLTGSDAYTNATEWAVWQFQQWGLEAELDEVGEVPIGFNRGPWFGKMVVPEEKALYFGTPSFTAGTKGLQRGGVVILQLVGLFIGGGGILKAFHRGITAAQHHPAFDVFRLFAHALLKFCDHFLN